MTEKNAKHVESNHAQVCALQLDLLSFQDA